MLGLYACSSATTPAGSGGSGGTGTGAAGGTGGNTGGKGGNAGGAGGNAGGSTAAGGSGGATGGGAGSGGSGSAVDGRGSTPDVAGPGTDSGAMADAPPVTGNLCAGAKKCFDFEDQMPGQPPSSPDFKVETTGGSLTTDTSKAFSGTKSILIKARTGTTYPGNNLVFSGIEKLLPDNDLHGRVMMWMTNTPGDAHWDSVIGASAGGAEPLYVLGGMFKRFMAVYHPGDTAQDSATAFPTGTWACIQWEFSGKGGKNLHKVMLNGMVVNNGITERWPAPTFSHLRVGHRHFSSTVTVDLWLDDLAFGDQPIACPDRK
jgi:hypothetical protein